MSYNFPWLKDTIQYDPYEEPDYPQPQESEIERPKWDFWKFDKLFRYRTPTIDKSVRVYTVAQESRKVAYSLFDCIDILLFEIFQ